MLRDKFALDRKESPCTYVQANGLGINALRTYAIENGLGEMKSGRGRCHGPPETRIQCLIAFQVDGLSLTIKIRRDRDGTASLKHS